MFTTADATAMPFGNGVFDRVIAAEVLEPFGDDQRHCMRSRGCCGRGGLLAVTVPAWLPERICWGLSDDYHNVPAGHVRIYTRPQLDAKLRRAGLTMGGHHWRISMCGRWERRKETTRGTDGQPHRSTPSNVGTSAARSQAIALWPTRCRPGYQRLGSSAA